MICGGQNGGRQHAGPFGSPRNIRLTSEVSVPCTYQSFGLTSEVSVPCTRHEVGYSSEVCRMHAGQAADTSDLPIQSRPSNRYFSVSVCLSLRLKWTPSWNLASTNLLWKSILANALWTISGAIILSGAPEGLITEPPFLHTRSVISLHQRWPRVSGGNGNGRGEPNGLWCVLVYVSGPCQPDDSFCLPVALRVIGQIQWNSNSEQRSWNLSFEQRSWNLSFQSRPKPKFEQQGWNHSSLDWNNYWSLSAAYDPQRCLCPRSAPRGNKSTARMAPDYQRSMIVGWPRLFVRSIVKRCHHFPPGVTLVGSAGICLSVCLSVCLCVCLSVCLSDNLCTDVPPTPRL